MKVVVSGNAIEIVLEAKEKVNDLSPFFQRAALYQERSTKLNFAKQSDPDGKGWSPLKPSTLKQKSSGAILRETSALVNSVFSRAGNSRSTIGATTEYGVFHQTGTSKMDDRKFLGFGEKDVKAITDMAEEMILL